MEEKSDNLQKAPCAVFIQTDKGSHLLHPFEFKRLNQCILCMFQQLHANTQ